MRLHRRSRDAGAAAPAKPRARAPLSEQDPSENAGAGVARRARKGLLRRVRRLRGAATARSGPPDRVQRPGARPVPGGAARALRVALARLRQPAPAPLGPPARAARSRHPLEGSWASRLLERNLAEYAQADRVYYASRYIRESFLEQGFPEERLAGFPLTPDPRYELAGAREPSDRFEIVYVGSLAVHKGVPLLIDAVRRLSQADIRLRLVGGWATPGVRRFVQRACATDRRIVVCPGDPLPHLRAARLYAHPAYEDGFGYAPAEALAAGVPLLVSEDTGMKELIAPGRNGLILPTGDLDALTETIEAAYRGEILAPGRL